MLEAQTKRTNTTKSVKTETDYSKNIARGVQYKTQEEAIMANAKAYAKKDFGIIRPALEENEASRETIVKYAEQLLARKVSAIRNKIAEIEAIDELETDLPF